MKNIVVGVDLYKSDEAVLKAAANLAQVTKATLQLIHLFPPEVTALDYVVYTPEDPAKREAAIAEDEKQLKALVEDLDTKGVRAEAVVKIGHASNGILEYAEEIQADAIVIGTHSRNFISRALIGSTADKVVRRSPVPLLVVPTV